MVLPPDFLLAAFFAGFLAEGFFAAFAAGAFFFAVGDFLVVGMVTHPVIFTTFRG